MAFVKFETVFTTYYFPEHQVVRIRVLPSDDASKGYHMTKVRFVGDFDVQEETFYGEPEFV